MMSSSGTKGVNSMSNPLEHNRLPSSGSSGFFQTSPRLENAFNEDVTLRRIFSFYLPKQVQEAIQVDLLRFGSLVLQPETLKLVADAEASLPKLRTHDDWGKRVDELLTGEGWRGLKRLGIEEGIVAIGYENEYGPYSRLYQFLKYHLWSPSAGMTTCPAAMQDGAAALLKAELERKNLPTRERQVFEKAYAHLTSRDPNEAWTSGQWMTERPGGSDVRNTETLATYRPTIARGSSTRDAEGTPLGPWSLSGFKWFSSATDSDMSVMLAREPSGTISAFYAPMRRQIPSSQASTPGQTELNGVQIQRLKNKLGTKPVPTAELILNDTRAYLVGEQGRGTKAISKILNITRVHTAMGCVGGWGRSLAVSCAFSVVRSTSGRLLIDTPAHVRTLAEQHVEYRAMMHLAFLSAALLGASESRSFAGEAASSHLFTTQTAPHLLRLITPIAKALTAKAAIAGVAECMESLGGVGYLENEDPVLNIARIFRDTNVNSIWEGTTNVLAHDLVRVLKGSSRSAVFDSMDAFVQRGTERWGGRKTADGQAATNIIYEAWNALKKRATSKDAEELVHRGREVAREFGYIICAILLGEDARHDGNPIAEEVFQRYISSRSKGSEHKGDWKDEAAWDKKIVFGDLSAERARL